MGRKKNNDTREKILTSAYQLFLAEPYDHIYLKDIAKASNISLNLLHHYYPKKTDLVVHIVYDMLIKLQKYVENTQEISNDFRVKNLLILKFMFHILSENNLQMLKVYSYILCNAKIMKKILDFYLPKTDPQGIDTIQKRYELYLLFGTISQIVTLRLDDQLPYELETSLEQVYCQYLLTIDTSTSEIQSIINQSQDYYFTYADSFTKKYFLSLKHFYECNW